MPQPPGSGGQAMDKRVDDDPFNAGWNACFDEANAEIERLRQEREQDILAITDRHAKNYANLLGEIERLRNALYEVTTNGEWTKGEQVGDWAISKEVYETARDAARDAFLSEVK
jgi:hypothetical protein